MQLVFFGGFFLGMFLTFGILVASKHRSKAKKDKQDTFDDIEFGVDYAISLLKEMGCKCTVDSKEKNDNGSNWIRCRFSYQGGIFYIMGNTDSVFVKLILPNVSKQNLSELEIIRIGCNKVNQSLTGHTRLEYDFVDNNESVVANVVSGFAIMSSISYASHYLQAMLNGGFAARDEFVSVLKVYREEQKKNNDKDVEKDYAIRSREIYLLRERELIHSRNKRNDLTIKEPTLQDFVRKTLSSEDILLHRMIITTSTGEIKKYDGGTVTSYGLYNDIIDVSSGVENAYFKCDWVSYTIDYSKEVDRAEEKKILLLFEKDFAEGKTLYIRATITMCGLPLSPMVSFASNAYHGYTKTLLLAFDKVADVSKKAEFEFMFKDMEDKLKAKKMRELSDEQVFIADCCYPNVLEKLYFGRKYFNEKRYYEAITHLESALPIWKKSEPDKMSFKEKHTFRELLFMLGFCYAEIEQYEKALYYLEMISFNSDIKYDMEYINCLTNSEDFRALPVVDRILTQLNEVLQNIDEEDDDMKQYISYRDFLLRRRCFILVEKGRLDEAEEMLQSMIENEINCDFALGEIAYIKKLREEKE